MKETFNWQADKKQTRYHDSSLLDRATKFQHMKADPQMKSSFAHKMEQELFSYKRKFKKQAQKLVWVFRGRLQEQQQTHLAILDESREKYDQLEMKSNKRKRDLDEAAITINQLQSQLRKREEASANNSQLQSQLQDQGRTIARLVSEKDAMASQIWRTRPTADQISDFELAKTMTNIANSLGAWIMSERCDHEIGKTLQACLISCNRS